MYETGVLRRTHLRRHDNIIKRLMIHAGAFNVGLVMRKLSACGTPRGLQGRIDALFFVLRNIGTAKLRRFCRPSGKSGRSLSINVSRRVLRTQHLKINCATGC
jgi:hypothetical protein